MLALKKAVNKAIECLTCTLMAIHGFGCDMASIYAICTKFSQYVFRRIFTLFTDMDLYVGRCLCILEKKALGD